MRFFNELKKYRNFLVYSTKGMLKSEVSTSYLNTLWWVLDPLFYMLAYSFVSIMVFRAQQQYYQIYIIIGVVIWNYYNKVLQGSVKLVSSNQAIISKVYVPKYIFLIRLILVNLFKLVISYALIFIMLMIWKAQVTPWLLMIIPLTMALVFLTFGAGMVLMHIGVYVSDVSNILTVVLRFQFYLSGIFYNMEKSLPNSFVKMVRIINPVYDLIEAFRKNVLYGSGSGYIEILYWMLVALAVSIFGVLAMYKKEGEYAKVN